MNISFITTEIEAVEGVGVITLILKMTEGAIGPVSIRIFTVEGTALGMLRNNTKSVYVAHSTILIHHKHHRSNYNEYLFNRRR